MHPITTWGNVYDLEKTKDVDWEDNMWLSVAQHSNHAAYRDTIRSINDLASTY